MGQRQRDREEPVAEPAPRSAALERRDERERRGDDSENAERIRPCLAGDLDDACVRTERDTRHQAAEAAQESRSEHDEERRSQRDRDS